MYFPEDCTKVPESTKNNSVLCTFSPKNERGLYRFLAVEILNAETVKDRRCLCQHVNNEHVDFTLVFKLTCRMLQYVLK